MAEATAPRLQDVASELKKTIDYFHTHYGEDSLAAAVPARGRSSREERVGASVWEGRTPRRSLATAPYSTDGANELGSASGAAGDGGRTIGPGLDDMKTHINLLPLKHRRRALLRRRVLQWSLAWAVCAIVAAGFCWSGYSRYGRSQAAREVAARAYAPLEKLIHQQDASRSQLRTMEAHGTLLAHLHEDRPLLALMGVVSESAKKVQRPTRRPRPPAPAARHAGQTGAAESREPREETKAADCEESLALGNRHAPGRRTGQPGDRDIRRQPARQRSVSAR